MVYVFDSFVTFLSVFFVFHRKNLVSLNLISRYMASTRVIFEKQKHFGPLQSKFCISKLFIQCNAGTCCVHITGHVNDIYLDVCVSLLVPVCPMWLSMCMILNNSTSKNHVIQSKLSINLIPCCIKHTARCCKVPRFGKFRSKISLSKITHYIWCDDTFKQRNKETKRKRGMEVGHNLKKRGNQYRDGLHKLGDLGTLCQICVSFKERN